MHAKTNLTDAIVVKVRRSTFLIVGVAVIFVGMAATLVFWPGILSPGGATILLGALAIAAGGLKEIAGIREREFRLEIDALDLAPTKPGVIDLRRRERLAGDWASAGSLYLWIFGIGAIFSAWGGV